MRVKKVNLEGSPLSSTLNYLKKHPTDLIVLATEGREGLPRWFQPSMAERIALKTKTMTLLVPEGAKGFVSWETGEVSLSRILIPMDRDPSPVAAIEYAARVLRATGRPAEVVLFHAGSGGSPRPEVPSLPNVTWDWAHHPGEPVEAILAAAEERAPDLIIMTTAGREGILDMLRGSVTQQVLRGARRPLLAVPVK